MPEPFKRQRLSGYFLPILIDGVLIGVSVSGTHFDSLRNGVYLAYAYSYPNLLTKCLNAYSASALGSPIPRHTDGAIVDQIVLEALPGECRIDVSFKDGTCCNCSVFMIKRAQGRALVIMMVANVPHSKCGVPQGTVGSNPTLSAI